MNYNYQKATDKSKSLYTQIVLMFCGVEYSNMNLSSFLKWTTPPPKHFFSKNGVSIIGLYIIHKRTHRYTKRCTVHTKVPKPNKSDSSEGQKSDLGGGGREGGKVEEIHE